MAGREDLRADARQQADDQAAKSRSQEGRQPQPVQQAFAQRDAAHDRDADRSPRNADCARNRKILTADVRHVQGPDPERAGLEDVGHEITDERG